MTTPHRSASRRRAVLTALGSAALLALTACGGGGGGSSNPLAAPSSTAAKGGTVVVGSANFPENVLLAQIYAKALTAKGVKVQTKLNIGSREVIYDQVKSGGLTVLPEYNGALLSFLDPAATASTKTAVDAALTAKLPATLEVLDSAPAEDKDAMVVTRATATKNHLTAVPDLAAVAGSFVVGGPPEFKTRQQGVVGLKALYGLTFKSFRPLDTAGPVTVAALKKGDIQVANLFTTDPAIVANDFVPLADPKNLFGAQNVVPLANRAGLSPTAQAALNAVSAKLDTPTLAQLVKKVVADKADADKVAAQWLSSVQLG